MAKQQQTYWAIVLKDDNFIPSFNVEGKFNDVLQIHSTKKSAKELRDKLGKGWVVRKVIINFESN